MSNQNTNLPTSKSTFQNNNSEEVIKHLLCNISRNYCKDSSQKIEFNSKRNFLRLSLLKSNGNISDVIKNVLKSSSPSNQKNDFNQTVKNYAETVYSRKKKRKYSPDSIRKHFRVIFYKFIIKKLKSRNKNFHKHFDGPNSKKFKNDVSKPYERQFLHKKIYEIIEIDPKNIQEEVSQKLIKMKFYIFLWKFKQNLINFIKKFKKYQGETQIYLIDYIKNYNKYRASKKISRKFVIPHNILTNPRTVDIENQTHCIKEINDDNKKLITSKPNDSLTFSNIQPNNSEKFISFDDCHQPNNLFNTDFIIDHREDSIENESNQRNGC